MLGFDCWYCDKGISAGSLAFSREWDTPVHIKCIENRLKEYPKDPECHIFCREFSIPYTELTEAEWEELEQQKHARHESSGLGESNGTELGTPELFDEISKHPDLSRNGREGNSPEESPDPRWPRLPF